MNSRDLKREFISNVLTEMAGYIDKTTADILRRTLEEQACGLNFTKISNMPATVQDTTEAKNQYYIGLMMIKKRNLSERTKKNYKDSIMRLATVTGKPLDEITDMDINYYLYWYQHRNEAAGGKINQPTTCNIERSYLSAFYAWMFKEGFVAFNPVARTEPFKEIEKPIDYYRPEQFEQLRGACRTLRDRALLEVLRSTGARVGEIVPINREDIDWNTGDVMIISEKSKKYRVLYLDETARFYLKKYLDSRTDSNACLFAYECRPFKRLSVDGIELAVRKIGKRSGADYRVYPHKMRKTLGMRLRNAGVDLGSIQEILGHANPDTTEQYYAQADRETLRSIRKRTA